MRCIAYVSMGLLISAPALAANVTYVFKAFVEHQTPGQGVPNGEPLGSVVNITVVVDKSVPGTMTAMRTETYQGGYACGSSNSPIVSATVEGISYQFGDGACNTIVIKKNVNGISSITFTSAQMHVGQTFYASFTTTSSTVVNSLRLPEAIKTTDFQAANYAMYLPDFNISGSLTN